MLKKVLVIALCILLTACGNNELGNGDTIAPSNIRHDFILTNLTHNLGMEYILQLESDEYSIGSIFLIDDKLLFDTRLNAGGWERDSYLFDLQFGNISMIDSEQAREIRTSFYSSHNVPPYDVRTDPITDEMHILLGDEVILSIPPLQLDYGQFQAVFAGFIDENTFAYHFYSGFISDMDARVGIMSLDGTVDIVFEGWYDILTRNGKTYIFGYSLGPDIGPMDGVWYRVDENFNLQPTAIQNTGHIHLSDNGDYVLLIYGIGEENERLTKFRIYNFVTEELVHQVEKTISAEFTALRNPMAVSNDGNVFAYAYVDGTIRIFLFD